MAKTCISCKGYGYIWDKSIFLLTVAAPLAWFLECDEKPTKNGFKQICCNCNGSGEVKDGIQS